MRPLIRQIDIFAEHLAESAGTPHDGDVARIARKMGLKSSSGNGLLQRLRREQGDQAK
jgi:hypothetical protein